MLLRDSIFQYVTLVSQIGNRYYATGSLINEIDNHKRRRVGNWGQKKKYRVHSQKMGSGWRAMELMTAGITHKQPGGTGITIAYLGFWHMVGQGLHSFTRVLREETRLLFSNFCISWRVSPSNVFVLLVLNYKSIASCI